MQRATASVTVFKTQMKIFEKKIWSDAQHDIAKVSTQSLLNRTDKVFAPPSSDHTDSQKMLHSDNAAAAMKKVLGNNINRIDLLTDAKIGDMKGLMKTMTDQIVKLSKRVQLTETELYKRMYEDLPVDVMALTKTEI